MDKLLKAMTFIIICGGLSALSTDQASASADQTTASEDQTFNNCLNDCLATKKAEWAECERAEELEAEEYRTGICYLHARKRFNICKGRCIQQYGQQ